MFLRPFWISSKQSRRRKRSGKDILNNFLLFKEANPKVIVTCTSLKTLKRFFHSFDINLSENTFQEPFIDSSLHFSFYNCDHDVQQLCPRAGHLRRERVSQSSSNIGQQNSCLGKCTVLGYWGVMGIYLRDLYNVGLSSLWPCGSLKIYSNLSLLIVFYPNLALVLMDSTRTLGVPRLLTQYPI
jgi:hypothetical protein